MEAECPPREVELSTLEAEKQPMAAAAEVGGGEGEPPNPPGPDPGPPPGGEKNGLVKLPQDEESGGGGEISGGCKFTGLGKEELLRAAGAPPWRKARTVLLLLFWLGWLGMLGAAAAIVARAPRCRPLPPRAWWQLGGLYRAHPRPFAGDLKGVAARLDHVAGLQMRGLVLGPLHPESGGDLQNLRLEELDPALGSLQDFTDLLQAAKKKGLEVIVDVTANPMGNSSWLGHGRTGDPDFHYKVQRALSVWLERGAAGVFLDSIEELEPSLVAECRNLTEQSTTKGVPRVLVGGTRLEDPQQLQALLNTSGVGLLLGPFLQALGSHVPPAALAPQLLGFLRPHTALAWSVSSPWQHLERLSPLLALQRLLLLWAALPGTPVLSYGDEVALAEPPELPPMPWEYIEKLQKGDDSIPAHRLELCRRLGALRVRERSLSLGEAVAIPAAEAAVFLRSWDQSERFLVVVNPGEEHVRLALRDPRLPPRATLRLSTYQLLAEDVEVDLGALELQPYEGLLLSFPYAP